MLCRLYDTKNKRYIKTDETLDYMVHPVGAVFVEGAEDHRIIVELSSGKEDKSGKEIFVGDRYKTKEPDEIYQVFFKAGAICGGKTFEEAIPLFWDNGPASQPTEDADWVSEYVEVIGTIHDEEMEAE